jgi:hypothetical protein
MSEDHHSHHPGGTNNTKDVIYIDVDDEITAVIDKLAASDKKIVALVLPKRATVLQSLVNMKLLKRAAGEAKKNLVLITSESGLLPLAGSVGIHVAKSLNSKPEVPDGPEHSLHGEAPIEVNEGAEIPLDGRKTVGELAGMPPADDEDETIELDDEDDPATPAAAGHGVKAKKNRKFRIPNFNKFRLMLLLAGVGVLLLGMAVYAAVAVWPEAKITIKTDSTAINSSSVVTLKTGADVKLDAEKAIVPAQLQEVKKTLTGDSPATGQKNNGDKASGSVDMTAKDCSAPFTTPSDLPSGTGITTDGKTYITQKKANFSIDSASGSCVYYKASSIGIVAQSAGSQYNVAGATFSVPGRSDVGASGSASGGTDNIVKIVTQADIDAAKKKITDQDNQPIQQELKSALIGRGLFAIEVTFNIGTPETQLSAEANAPAEAVTVTQTINYSMLGAKQDDLDKIIEKSVETKIDAKKQTILTHGLDNGFFSLQGVNPDGASVSMQTTVVAGAALNKDTIKKQVSGKKSGDAKELISANPGVTDVSVELSPFWVSSIPSRADKITVIIEEPKVTSQDAKSP